QADPAEPNQDSRVAAVMRRDEERARFGLEQFVAVLQAGAAYEERVGQLVNPEKQRAAYPERGKPVVRLLDAPRQGQGDLADVSLGHHQRMVRQLRLAPQLPSSFAARCVP